MDKGKAPVENKQTNKQSVKLYWLVMSRLWWQPQPSVYECMYVYVDECVCDRVGGSTLVHVHVQVR